MPLCVPTLAATGLLVASLLLAGCGSSHFEPPQVEGPAAMVDDGGKPRLWVLSKQEEWRQIAVGGSGPNSVGGWRTDTFFHFSVQAFDPVAAKPLWQRRLLTYGDPDAKGEAPSRVIGSSVAARMLGQDGNIVWLLIGSTPFALNAADGKPIADSEALQRINPELKGLLPSEARHYGFDQGLVLMSADARQFVIRGPGQKAVPYTLPPPAAEPEGPLLANGRHELVPMRPPIGEVPARQATLGGQWLGLYSEKEAIDLGDDEMGRNLRWPYTVINEGALARRSFWRAKIVTAQRFEDRFQRLTDLRPIPGAPTFLKGRFLTDPRTGEPLLLDEPAGLLVWHSTRIDSAGRLALTRLDANLRTVWTAELPLSETDIVRPLATWQLPGRLVVVGTLEVQSLEVTRRAQHLVSIDLKTGALRAWSFPREAPVP